MSASATPRSRRLQTVVVTVLLVIILPLAAGSLLLVSLGPGFYKPRIAEAVQRATGRELTLDGPIRLRLAPAVTITAENVALANMPGGSRTEMLRAARLAARLAVWPLLHGRLEFDRVAVSGADLLLETSPDGHRNWRFVRPKPVPGASAVIRERVPVVVRAVYIADSRITWLDRRNGFTRSIGLAALDLTEADDAAPIQLDARLDAGLKVALSGTVGSLARLRDPDATTPFPVDLALDAGDAHLALAGSFTRPARGKGYALRLSGAVPDLAALAPLFPGTNLPPSHGITLAAGLADTGARLPAITALSLHAGVTDLGVRLSGLLLDHLDLAAPSADQPVRLDLAGSYAAVPLTLAATLDPPAAALSGHVVALRDLRLNLGASDVEGTARIALAAHPRIVATLNAHRLVLDPLLAAWSRAAAAEPAAPPSEKPPSEKLLSEQPGETRIIPAARLPLGTLRRVDALLDLGIAEFDAGGLVYRNVAAHVALDAGRLRLDPLAAEAPGGHLAGRLEIDAAHSPPLLALRLDAPGLALQPLLAALDLPGDDAGQIEVAADLHGAGGDLRALAASLDGRLGLAMVDGAIDNRIVNALLAGMLRDARVKLPLPLDVTGGRSVVRCLALRADATDGVATLRMFDLDMVRFALAGSGRVDLRDETLALALRPLARLGGDLGVVVPLAVDGRFRAPRVVIDRAAPPARSGDARSDDDCPAALALARDGRAGPTPAPLPALKGPNLRDLLRGLAR